MSDARRSGAAALPLPATKGLTTGTAGRFGLRVGF